MTTLIRAVITTLVLASALGVTRVEAQDGIAASRSKRFEFRPYVGGYFPTGDQRDLLEDAVFAGAQLSWRAVPRFAVTGTFGWAPTRDRLQAGDETLDLFQYDIGGELRAPSWYRARSWDFTPFASLGVGGRTYDYRDLDVDSKTNVAGYGALGGEFGFRSVGLRLEARDYISRFEPLTGNGDTSTRNDITVAAGLTVRF